MADTGSPWNIPYVAGTDLVADWPTDNQTMAEAIADALDIGLGTNVVQTVKTDTYSESIASGAIGSDITGLTVSITPSSATSKVLVLVQLNVSQSASDNGVDAILYRGGSVSSYVGDAAGNRKQVSAGTSVTNAFSSNTISLIYVDSPATTSSVTYSVRLATGTSVTRTVYVNRFQDDSDSTQRNRSASSITAIEVAA